jgi:hypothetical protein
LAGGKFQRAIDPIPRRLRYPISSPRPVPVDFAAAEAPMASPQPPTVDQRTATADSAPPTAAASRVDGGAAAAGGGTVTDTAAGSKRKKMGTHVVGQGQPAAAGQVGPAIGAPSTPPVRPVAKTPPIPKQCPKKPAVKPPVVKKSPAKKASLTTINAAVAAMPVAGGGHTHDVFDEIPEEVCFYFLLGKVSSFAVNLIVCLFCGAAKGQIHLLACSTMHPSTLTKGRLVTENGHIGIDDADDVEEEGGDDDLEEVDAGTYEDAASKNITLQEGRQTTPRWKTKL